MKYTVWTGSKFKGSWDDKELALSYMAARVPAERKEWTLVPVDLNAGLDAEVEEMVARVSEKTAPTREVHHLKAKSIEASSHGEVKGA